MDKSPGYLCISRQLRRHSRRHHHLHPPHKWWLVLVIGLAVLGWMGVMAWGWSGIIENPPPAGGETTTTVP